MRARGRITAAAVALTGALNVVIASGATSAADPAAPGTVAVSISGPTSITINPNRVPERVFYTITLVYQGPPITNQPVTTQWTVRASPLFNTPGADQLLEGNMFSCSQTPPPTPAVSCTSDFLESRRTTRVSVGMRPTGQAGTATNTLEVATGATATATTEITRASPPPPPPPPPQPPPEPAPIPGPAAAPTQTFVETFTQPGQTQAESVSVAPAAATIQVALTWPDAASSFDATGFQFVVVGSQGGRGVPQAETAPPIKVKATKRRTARALDVRIKPPAAVRTAKPRRVQLRFKIVAKRVEKRTRVTVKVRQSKRR